MPLWLYTFGQHAYLNELKICIPYFNLAQSLLTINLPIGIGMLLHYFFPKLQPIVRYILKTIMVLLLIYFLMFGLVANYYLHEYVDATIIFAAILLPWLGFSLGDLFAWICRQDWK
ncbi:unnamed protein product [Rotaria magnacalcarata]|uniref:Uncharacterized protein n=1 Tax=Rotaria magnacalcarata TaxID=392030 RepID=A0A815JWU8_9BILA|nr:unnamed protein product [Rotaria magnacalcarata]